MQNFKDVILKNLCSAVIFFTYLLVMPSVWMAEGADVPPQIFIGNGPSAITIQQGMPVEIPVFFVGGTYCDKTVELYVFRTEDGRNVCFGPEGWESDDAIALEDFKPLCNVPGLPEYLLLQWQAFKDSQSLSDFDLCICVDDQIDGIFTASSSCCGCQSIIIEEVDDNSTGDDTGTGDDSGSGGDTDTGDVSSPGLVAPPFPNLGGGSGGACSSLEYTIEGTTVSQSYIRRSLELGESEQITLIVSACGSSVTVSSAYEVDPIDDPWLSVDLSGGKLILGLDAGVTGLQSGSTYTGAVTLTAGEISDTMSVILHIPGQCDPTSASVVSPASKSLTFSAYVEGPSPSAQTIHIEDNCGDAVSATVVSKPDFITLTPTTTSSTGVFSVSCVESKLDEEGSYSGNIIFEDGEYDPRHSVSVNLEVTDTPSSPSQDDRVTTVRSGDILNVDVPAKEAMYFRFSASVSDCSKPIQLISTPLADQPFTVHMLIKRGSKPSPGDFFDTWDMPVSDYDCDSGRWVPSKPKDLYWKYNSAAFSESVHIGEPMESSTFYIMLYNNGSKKVQDQCLTISYYQ